MKIRGEEISKTIKLPKDWKKKFNSKSKILSPYEKFYKWIIKEVTNDWLIMLYDKNNITVNVTCVCVVTSVANQLEKLTLSWLRKVHKIPLYRAREEMHWINFNIGPCELYIEDDVDKNTVYLLNEYIVLKEGRYG